MNKLPESINLGYSTLDEIYPFHLIIENNSQLMISHCGPALSRCAQQLEVGQSLVDHFVFQRPIVENPNYQLLLNMVGKLVCLAAIHSGLVLRGQFVPIEGERLLYLSTVHVTTTDTLSDMEVSLTDFPAHDFVPDLLILQRIKEMQLEELTSQNQELSLVIKERDQFDHFANTDSMTQLFNRRGFEQRGPEYLDSMNGIVGSALLLIDVDNFKSINDMYGHSAGDAVLVEIAKRLSSKFGENTLVGRWGGDEFVVLIGCDIAYGPNTEQQYDCIESIRGEMNHRDKTIDICLSCGIVDTRISNNLERLIYYADLTMYEGRRKGAGKTLLFQGEMQSIIRYREDIFKYLIPAIDERQFVPYFQPILDISSTKLIGFEALARWPSDELGMVMPLDFIEVIESRNMLKEFDYMMLSLVVDQLAEWYKRFPDIKVHINLSAPSFTKDLTQRLIALMRQSNVPCDRLVIEVTETSLFISVDDIGQVISDLIAAGFSVELDDFGTGYSSLMHLKDFPVTGLKVDMSFVRDAESNEHMRRLLAGILVLANNLNLHCVAEGVETVEQFEMLAELDCDSAQGYLFSKPIPAQDCTVMLEQGSVKPLLKKRPESICSGMR